MSRVEVDGVAVSVDSESYIGWMEDWAAIFDLHWLDRGLVEAVEHNSGGLGGFSYRLTASAQAADTARARAARDTIEEDA